MKRLDWMIGACLGLLVLGGLGVDVSAQQSPPAQTAPAETKPQAPDTGSQPSQPSAPRDDSSSQTQAPQNPSTNTQTETRIEKSERVVEREAGKFLGVDATVAMIIGAVVLIVIVIGLVAMSRRGDEVHTHRRDTTRV